MALTSNEDWTGVSGHRRRAASVSAFEAGTGFSELPAGLRTGPGYGRSGGFVGFMAAIIHGITRLILPVAGLLGACALALHERGATASLGFAGAPGLALDLGLVLLALAFLAVVLTARRYGLAPSLQQILVAALIAALLFAFARPELELLFGTLPDPASRPVAAMLAGLIAGLGVCALAFDFTRGPRWWSGPFFGLLWGGLVFALIAQIGGLAGTGADWTQALSVHALFAGAAAIVLLVPYWVMRPMIRPMPGFNGA